MSDSQPKLGRSQVLALQVKLAQESSDSPKVTGRSQVLDADNPVTGNKGLVVTARGMQVKPENRANSHVRVQQKNAKGQLMAQT